MQEESLVKQVHREVKKYLKKKDIAIDCTVGNGHDTAFLAHCVGKRGRVLGIDIQHDALVETEKRLKKEDLMEEVVQLEQVSHEDILEVAPKEWLGQVAAVMFNLGYLPGGDKTIITQPESTIKGLKGALKLLRVGGILSVMIYPDHNGGAEEAEAVDEWAKGLESGYKIMEKGNKAENGPRWIGIVKIA